MEASINFLQEEMHKLSKQTSTNVNNNIENCNNAIIGDDVILLALAGLKQVKLIFNQANQMFNTCFFQVKDQLNFSFTDEEKNLSIDETDKKLKSKSEEESAENLRLGVMMHFRRKNSKIFDDSIKSRSNTLTEADVN